MLTLTRTTTLIATNRGPLAEWQFRSVPRAEGAGVLDVRLREDLQPAEAVDALRRLLEQLAENVIGAGSTPSPSTGGGTTTPPSTGTGETPTPGTGGPTRGGA